MSPTSVEGFIIFSSSKDNLSLSPDYFIHSMKNSSRCCDIHKCRRTFLRNKKNKRKKQIQLDFPFVCEQKRREKMEINTFSNRNGIDKKSEDNITRIHRTSTYKKSSNTKDATNAQKMTKYEKKIDESLKAPSLSIAR